MALRRTVRFDALPFALRQWYFSSHIVMSILQRGVGTVVTADSRESVFDGLLYEDHQGRRIQADVLPELATALQHRARKLGITKVQWSGLHRSGNRCVDDSFPDTFVQLLVARGMHVDQFKVRQEIENTPAGWAASYIKHRPRGWTESAEAPADPEEDVYQKIARHELLAAEEAQQAELDAELAWWGDRRRKVMAVDDAAFWADMKAWGDSAVPPAALLSGRVLETVTNSPSVRAQARARAQAQVRGTPTRVDSADAAAAAAALQGQAPGPDWDPDQDHDQGARRSAEAGEGESGPFPATPTREVPHTYHIRLKERD